MAHEPPREGERLKYACCCPSAVGCDEWSDEPGGLLTKMVEMGLLLPLSTARFDGLLNTDTYPSKPQKPVNLLAKDGGLRTRVRVETGDGTGAEDDGEEGGGPSQDALSHVGVEEGRLCV